MRSHTNKMSRRSAHARSVALLFLAGRFAIIVAIVWAGWGTLRSVRILLSGADIAPANVDRALPPTTESVAVGLPLDGAWSFGQSGWGLTRATTTRSEVAHRMAELSADANAPEHESSTKLGDLFSLAAVGNVDREPATGQTVYSFDLAGAQARLVTHSDGGSEEIVSGAFARKLDDGNWELVELAPASADDVTNRAHLVTLPDTARRTCSRRDDKGRLLMELVALNSANLTGKSLVAAWREEGWEFRRSDGATDAFFSFVGARGDDVVYAWSPDPPGRLSALVLVRVPSTAASNATEGVLHD